MPTITLESEGIPNLLPMIRRPRGLHLTTVTWDYARHVVGTHQHVQKFGRALEVDEQFEFIHPEFKGVQTLTQLGEALEHAIAHRYSLKYPGECFHINDSILIDGIWMSPDLWWWQDHILDEVKYTRYSSNKKPGCDEFVPYELQLASYCYGFNCLVGRLRIVHANGDYSRHGDSGNPQYRVWRYEYTKQELDDHWLTMITHAKSGAFQRRLKEKGDGRTD